MATDQAPAAEVQTWPSPEVVRQLKYDELPHSSPEFVDDQCGSGLMVSETRKTTRLSSDCGSGLP